MLAVKLYPSTRGGLNQCEVEGDGWSPEGLYMFRDKKNGQRIFSDSAKIRATFNSNFLTLHSHVAWLLAKSAIALVSPSEDSTMHSAVLRSYWIPDYTICYLAWGRWPSSYRLVH